MTTELAPQSDDGDYVRPRDAFIVADPPTFARSLGKEGRLYLYVGNACPWCHRATLAIALLGLGDAIRVVALDDDPERASRGGWIVRGGRDPLYGAADLAGVYDAAVGGPPPPPLPLPLPWPAPASIADPPPVVQRCTAPLLITGSGRIASNNSTNIVAVLSSLSVARGGPSLLPGVGPGWSDDAAATAEILDASLHRDLCDGVYRCGFATTQRAHDAACTACYTCLSSLEERLRDGGPFLLGAHLSSVDVALFPTLCRFDAIYGSLFGLSRQRVRDFPCLLEWLNKMFSLPGARESFDLDGAVRSYHASLFPLNPSGRVPGGGAWSLEEIGVDERTPPLTAEALRAQGHLPAMPPSV